jgi:uncharacterized protein involved in exopolysaccharide biosynthesis
VSLALKQLPQKRTDRVVVNWKFVCAMALCGAVLAVLVSIIRPGKYESTATLLLDTTDDFSGIIGASGLSDLLPLGALGMGSARESGYAYLQLCKSNSVIGDLLPLPDPSNPGSSYFDTFAPKTGTQAARTEEAILALSRCILASYDPRSNVFRVTVRTHGSKASADIANQIVAGLKRFNSDVRTTRARDGSAFVRARLEESRSALSQAEARLATFQGSNVRLGNSPALALQLKRLDREVRQNEELFSLLSRQLELSQIQEKKEAPVFSVVDTAVAPSKKAGVPVVIAGVLGALFCGITAFLIGIAVTRPWSPLKTKRFSEPAIETCLDQG